MNLQNNLKRFLSGIISVTITATMLPSFPAFAEETVEKYPYTMFAASDEEGAITINSGNFCVNGNIATNGTIVSSGNMNVNGKKKEYIDEEMIYIFDKIDSSYFSGNNFDIYNDDFVLDELNISVDIPTEVEGETDLTGNININAALKALENINLKGEVKNTNESLIFSEYGDILIDSQNVNLNGLVYAPFGDVEITAQNLNLNNVIIIADSITLNCPNLNVNYGINIANFVGMQSEECPMIAIDTTNMVYNSENEMYYATNELECINGILGKPDEKINLHIDVYDMMHTLIFSEDVDPKFQWSLYEPGLMCGLNYVSVSATDINGIQYSKEIKLLVDTSKFVGFMQVDLEDNDEDKLWNYMEVFLGTNPNNSDTDDDKLSDWVEIYVLGYNPLEPDTDGDGVLDSKEDEDDDGLSNGEEANIYETSPIFSDTDCEGLLDGKEIEINTSPLIKDTDEDEISDYDEYNLLNTDPLTPDSSEATFTKTFTSSDIEGEFDSAVMPTIELRGDFTCIKTFKMYMMERTPNINVGMVGYLGAAYDFSANGRFDGATLTFNYDPDLILEEDQSLDNFEPAIYYYNEETCCVEEVENQIWHT